MCIRTLQRWTRPCWRTAPIGWFGEADINKHVDLCNRWTAEVDH